MAPLQYQEDEFMNMSGDIPTPASDVLLIQGFEYGSTLSPNPYGSAESTPLSSDLTILTTSFAIPSARQQFAWGSKCDFAWATGEVMPVDDATDTFAFSVPPTPPALHDEGDRLYFNSSCDTYVCDTCGSSFGRRCDLSSVT